MKDKTKDWIKAISSILLFNVFLCFLMGWVNIINAYTLSLKIILDITIAFVSDKTIKSLRINFKDGFCVER